MDPARESRCTPDPDAGAGGGFGATKARRQVTQESYGELEAWRIS